jgi:hypothetical protein
MSTPTEPSEIIQPPRNEHGGIIHQVAGTVGVASGSDTVDAPPAEGP